MMTDRTSSTPLASHTDSMQSTGNDDYNTEQYEYQPPRNPFMDYAMFALVITVALPAATVATINQDAADNRQQAYDIYEEMCIALEETTNIKFSITECVSYWNIHPEATEQEVFDNMDLQIMNQSLEDPIIIPNNDSDT